MAGQETLLNQENQENQKGSNTQTQEVVPHQSQKPTFAQGVSQAAMATLGTVFVTSPLDKCVTILVTNEGQKKNAFATFMQQPFKGFQFTFTTNFFKNLAIFGTNPFFASFTHKHITENPIAGKIISFALSSIPESFVNSYINVGRQVLYTTNIKSFEQFYSALPQENRFKVMMSPYGTNLAKGAIFWPVFMLIADKISEKMNVNDPNESLPKKLAKSVIAGSVAGGLAASLSYPIDVIQKVKVNHVVLNELKGKGLLKEEPTHHLETSTWKITKDLFKKEGIKRFYRGFSIAGGIRMPAAFGMTFMALQAEKCLEETVKRNNTIENRQKIKNFAIQAKENCKKSIQTTSFGRNVERVAQAACQFYKDNSQYMQKKSAEFAKKKSTLFARKKSESMTKMAERVEPNIVNQAFSPN